jgi:hypothetical protein
LRRGQIAQHLGRWANLDAFAAGYVALDCSRHNDRHCLYVTSYQGGLADYDSVIGGNIAIEVTID